MLEGAGFLIFIEKLKPESVSTVAIDDEWSE